MCLDHILTVDCEEYFSSSTAPDQWDEFPPRIVEATTRLLDLFESSSVYATFFVLGWVAHRYPGLLREILRRGHEIGCHSYYHRHIDRMTRKEFSADARRARDAIEHAVGRKVLGFRAPFCSISAHTAWALDALAEIGFAYDSSVFPVVHDTYGWPGADPYPCVFATSAGSIWELPPTSLHVIGSVRVGIGSGGYLRMLPFSFTKFVLERSALRRPLILYVHPWEFDYENRWAPPGRIARIRHTLGKSSMSEKMSTLLREYRFTKVETALRPLEARH